MAIRTVAQLKTWFQKGKYPTAAQFADWLDSFFHKTDKFPIDTVDGLPEQLNSKYDASSANVLENSVASALEKANEVKVDMINAFESIAELENEDERIRTDFEAADTETRTSAKSYTDERELTIRADFAAADATALASAKTYTDGKDTKVRTDFAAADATTLASAKTYTDGKDTKVRTDFAAADATTLASAKSYADTKANKTTATTAAAGLMSSADKSKLDGIAASANNYIHPATHAATVVTQDATHRFVTDTEKTTWNGKAGTATASASGNGLMSSSDKSKLDGIAANANNYVHPASHPATIITQDATHRFVTDTEKTAWNTMAGATDATPTVSGLMSASDKKKLDGIAASANNYVHPATHAATVVTQDATHRFVTDTEKTTWNGKAGTATASASGNGLMSSSDKSKLDGIAASANNYVHPATHAATVVTQDATHRFVTDAEKFTWNQCSRGFTYAPASNRLNVEFGTMYYYQGPDSITVENHGKFSPAADCAILVVPGNITVNFNPTFKLANGVSTLFGTDMQLKIYTIQMIYFSDMSYAPVVNAALYQ